MPGLLKVGFSTKDPHLRARELSHTGSPRPYIVEYDALVRAPRETEQLIHKALRGQRDGKEWFRCTLDQAVAAIQSVALERLSEEYRVAPTAQKVNELKTSSPKPVSMPRARSNSSARWRWSERTQQLVEKVDRAVSARINILTTEVARLEDSRFAMPILRGSPLKMSRSPHSALTNRSSGRVRDKVPSSYVGARAAQLNR
jgi:hypothetical protein